MYRYRLTQRLFLTHFLSFALCPPPSSMFQSHPWACSAWPQPDIFTVCSLRSYLEKIGTLQHSEDQTKFPKVILIRQSCLIHSVNYYLLITYYVSDTILCTGNMATNKTDSLSSCSLRSYSRP